MNVHTSDPVNINNFFAQYFQQPGECNDSIKYYDFNRYKKDSRFSFRLADISPIHKVLNNIKTKTVGTDGILQNYDFCIRDDICIAIGRVA